jgi:hypothetical protein
MKKKMFIGIIIICLITPILFIGIAHQINSGYSNKHILAPGEYGGIPKPQTYGTYWPPTQTVTPSP